MMKRILMTLLATWLFGLAVYAQQYNTATYLTTLEVDASSTSNLTTTAGLTKFEDVTVQVSAKLTAAGTGSATFSFARSVDGTTFETTPGLKLHLVNAGTTTTSALSNWNIGAVGYLRLVSLVNADDDGVLSNIVLRVTTKPARFGR